MIVLAVYLLLFVGSWTVLRLLRQRGATGVFGDIAAVRPYRAASVLSVLSALAIWGAFTGSRLVPLHVPGPFLGETGFRYGAEGPEGVNIGTLRILVHRPEAKPAAPQGQGAFLAPAWRTTLLRPVPAETRIVQIEGQALTPGLSVLVPNGSVTLTPKGALSFTPNPGWQMEPIWLPAPEAVAARFWDIAKNGYQNTALWEHLGFSLFRVLSGLVLGALVGVPLGYLMALSGWFRGWFDPIVEFMRPVPPLALIPLIIIWFGIWESGKIILLFLAALWIMVIAARSGIAAVRLSKVHAAYSLGASRMQVLWHILIPNSLPEIFTGLRVALGVCWGTVVAAELVAAEKGAGMMILVASKFQLTDIVVMGIILIGVIGYSIDILMRWAEAQLVPWKGRG